MIGYSPSNMMAEQVKQQSKWRCSECHFDNYPELLACELCQHARPEKDKSKKIKEENSAAVDCRNKECRSANPLDVEFCLECGHPLFEEEKERVSKTEKVRIDKDLIKCYHCKLQNHKMYKKCLNCNKPLVTYAPPASFPLFGYGGAIHQQYCELCNTPLKNRNPHTGQWEVCDCQLEQSKDSQICSFCDTKVPHQEKQLHRKTCQKRLVFFDRHKNSSMERCTKLQADTILYMHQKMERLHLKYKKSVLKKIRKLGYTESDLQNLQHYITHYAPIIVHMRANVHHMHFLEDTHYRNAFEIHKGAMGDGGRVQWEDRMFDERHHDATPFERVKYGTMNFTNDPKGVAVASGYGQSYLLLKSHVRDRCTITDMDSASSTATIATFRFVNHLLMKLSNAEIRAAIEGSKGKEMQSNVIHAYKEIQIHGPLEFSKDVERVYLSRAEINTSKEVKATMIKFCQYNKLEYEEFEARNPYGAGGLFGGGGQKAQVKAAGERFVDQDHLNDKKKEEVNVVKGSKTTKKKYRR